MGGLLRPLVHITLKFVSQRSNGSFELLDFVPLFSYFELVLGKLKPLIVSAIDLWGWRAARAVDVFIRRPIGTFQTFRRSARHTFTLFTC